MNNHLIKNKFNNNIEKYYKNKLNKNNNKLNY